MVSTWLLYMHMAPTTVAAEGSAAAALMSKKPHRANCQFVAHINTELPFTWTLVTSMQAGGNILDVKQTVSLIIKQSALQHP